MNCSLHIHCIVQVIVVMSEIFVFLIIFTELIDSLIFLIHYLIFLLFHTYQTILFDNGVDAETVPVNTSSFITIKDAFY